VANSITWGAQFSSSAATKQAYIYGGQVLGRFLCVRFYITLYIVAYEEGVMSILFLVLSRMQNFGRGEISSFLMKAPDEIGIPVSLQIWHDNSGGNAAGWYLGKVVLIDMQQKRW